MLDTARDRVAPAVATAGERLTTAARAVRDRVVVLAAATRERLAPAAAATKERLDPALAATRRRLSPAARAAKRGLAPVAERLSPAFDRVREVASEIGEVAIGTAPDTEVVDDPVGELGAFFKLDHVDAMEFGELPTLGAPVEAVDEALPEPPREPWSLSTIVVPERSAPRRPAEGEPHDADRETEPDVGAEPAAEHDAQRSREARAHEVEHNG